MIGSSPIAWLAITEGDYVAATPGTFVAAWARNRNTTLDEGDTMKKNVAGQAIGAQMCSATDGSAFTGAVTVYVCGDAGAQAVGSVGAGACTHEGNGYHTYAPAQAETNYNLIGFTFIGSGAIPSTVQVATSFPQTVDLSTGITSITGNITGNLSGSVGSVTGAVGSVTGNVGGNVTGSTGSVVGAVGSVTGNVGGNVVGSVASVTGAVGSVTGNVGGNVVGSVASVTAVVSADITKIGSDTTALTAFKQAVLGNVVGTVGAASTTTSIVTSSLTPAAAVIDQFKGRIVIFDKDTATANLRGQATDITASTALGVLTVTALTTAPASSDTFTIT